MDRLTPVDRAAASTARLTARVVNSSGAEVAKFDHTLGPDQFKSGGGADYSLDIPVSTLTPGYLLTVRATVGAKSDVRHVRFQVD